MDDERNFTYREKGILYFLKELCIDQQRCNISVIQSAGDGGGRRGRGRVSGKEEEDKYS
jgi:hypothetical protein